ncbi:alpha/beta fold hydrolase [Streptomyces sp. NPDC006175]|uniref:thioesterase II family protein n=1 Tax=Streptomyces sp. NPDC006175 TaxID=3154471 RepID=UPI0033B1B3FF
MNPDVSNPSADGAWVRRFHRADDSVRLVCLPHAGGSAAFYRPMSAALSPDVSTFAVQYPGRQDRIREPCVESIPELADAIFDALAPLAGESLALFGHSMGATLAFELAVRMEKRLGRSPSALFLSGRRAPAHFRAEADFVHTRDDAGIVAELAALSGTAPELLENQEILDMVLPMLRSDYRAIETHRGGVDDVVSCPVTVLTGESDDRVSVQEAAGWAAHTRGDFALETFSGGHFFLDDHRDAVAGIVRAGLKGTRSEARPASRQGASRQGVDAETT